MLFWLKKAATVPFLPLYATLLLGVAGVLLLSLRKRERLGRLLCALAILVLGLASNKAVATFLLQSLERQYPAISEARAAENLPRDVASCTAFVVLGGGHSDSPGLSRVNQLSTTSMSRLAEAVRLCRLLPNAKLIVSGHHRPELSHAQVLAEAAESLGIAPARILRMDTPRDTEDEAHELAKLVGHSPVGVVTSAWHMPRAIELCHAAGVNAVPCPADFMLRPAEESEAKLFVWNLEALEQSTKAIHERLGSLWLRLRGK